ncbi:MAG: hypothetical protein ABMA64_27230, partial [Myxococcota bacterium]
MLDAQQPFGLPLGGLANEAAIELKNSRTLLDLGAPRLGPFTPRDRQVSAGVSNRGQVEESAVNPVDGGGIRDRPRSTVVDSTTGLDAVQTG